MYCVYIQNEAKQDVVESIHPTVIGARNRYLELKKLPQYKKFCSVWYGPRPRFDRKVGEIVKR